MIADAARLAVGTLTALPVPPPRTIDRVRSGAAMTLAPAVGALLLVPVGVVVWLAHLVGLPPMVQACCGVIALQLCTRGIHLDGLADTADGLSASYDRDRALAVMHTGDVGPSGAAALTLTLLLQIACAAVLLGQAPALAGFAVVLSRAAPTLTCADGIPAALPEGLGATVAQSVPRSAAAVIVAVLFAAGAGVGVLGDVHWWAPPVALLGGLLAGAVLLRRCVRRLGGINGDVLGAAVEITLAASLLAAAACL